MDTKTSNDITTTSQKLASTERQRFLVLHLGWFKGWAMAYSHNHNIGHLYMQQCYRRYRNYFQTMSVKGASTIFGLPSWIIRWQCNSVNPWSYYWLHLWATMLVMILQPPCLCISLYSTSQICMRCLTGRTFFLLVALKSIFKNQHSTWL